MWEEMKSHWSEWVKWIDSFIVLRKWYEYFISNHGIQQPEHEV